MKIPIFLWFILLAILIFYLTSINAVINHEDVHDSIRIMHGCNKTETNYNFLLISGTNECLSKTNISLEEARLHSENEIVSYSIATQIDKLFYLICLLGIFVLYLIDKNNI